MKLELKISNINPNKTTNEKLSAKLVNYYKTHI